MAARKSKSIEQLAEQAKREVTATAPKKRRGRPPMYGPKQQKRRGRPKGSTATKTATTTRRKKTTDFTGELEHAVKVVNKARNLLASAGCSPPPKAKGRR